MKKKIANTTLPLRTLRFLYKLVKLKRDTEMGRGLEKKISEWREYTRYDTIQYDECGCGCADAWMFL